MNLDPKQIREIERGIMSATIQINGVPHSVDLIQMIQNLRGTEVPVNPKAEYRLSQHWHAMGHTDRLRTIKIPGYPGDWIIFITPQKA